MSFPSKKWDKNNSPTISIELSKLKKMLYIATGLGIFGGIWFMYFSGLGC